MKRLINLILWTGAWVKNTLIDRGWIKCVKVDIPVISVGNLVPGGSGKTAMVQWLAERLPHVAILTRGYKSLLEHKTPTLITPATPVSICGDEPAMLANLPCKPSVFVGKRRTISAQKADAKVILLDDGMQYRYLKRDIEIVMLSLDDLDGKILRESPSSLKRADLIVIMGVYDKNECTVLLQKLAQVTNAKIAGVHYALPDMTAREVAAFCALGTPERFFSDLKRAGAKVVATKTKRDHAAFTAAELKAFAQKSGAPLVCTRKDGVKLQDIDVPHTVIDANLEFAFGLEHMEGVLREVVDQNSYRSGSRSCDRDCAVPT